MRQLVFIAFLFSLVHSAGFSGEQEESRENAILAAINNEVFFHKVDLTNGELMKMKFSSWPGPLERMEAILKAIMAQDSLASEEIDQIRSLVRPVVFQMIAKAWRQKSDLKMALSLLSRVLLPEIISLISANIEQEADHMIPNLLEEYAQLLDSDNQATD